MGGGIFVWGNSSPTITQNEIVGNTLTATTTKLFYGGGIYIDSNIGGGQVAAKPVITQNLIEGNVADPPAGTTSNPSYATGGAIYSGGDAAPTIDNNTIRDNSVGNAATAHQIAGGGGIAMYGRAAAGTPVVSRNLIQGNWSADWAGGLQAGGFFDGAAYLSGVGTVENNIFDGNVSTNGGAGRTDTTSILIRNNTFVNNKSQFGAGLYLMQGNTAAVPTLANNLFTFNVAYQSLGGGGLYVADTVIPSSDTTTSSETPRRTSRARRPTRATSA